MRGCCTGLGSTSTVSKFQWRPSCANGFSPHAAMTMSSASWKRLRLSAMSTSKASNSCRW
jgi:hypothetical protein